MTAPDFEATADAFGWLADPVRVEILAALWRTDASPVPYSDLRDAVGLRDSGRFNYHLSKLTDHFVEKAGDGYRLRPTGLLVVNAIYAGSFVDAPTRTGIDVGGSCPSCGGGLVAEYDAGMFRVACVDCGEQQFMLSFPPRGVTSRDDEELVHAVAVHARAHTRRVHSGLCSFCGGSTTATLDADADVALPASVVVVTECGNCGAENRASVGFAVLEHPAVAGFLAGQGVPRDAPPWQFDWCLGDDAVTVLSADPLRAGLTVTAGGETLRVEVDGACRVVDAERT